MLSKQLSGKYKLIKLINNGPYAKVYHAKDTITAKSVAIKALQGCTTKSVEQEIQAMSRLTHHPHIVNLVEVFVDKDEKVYIVTEYAKLGDLYETVVRNGGRFNEDVSRHYFRHLMSAVKHCHERGVYHRDIKPENLLIDEQWRVKLSDFGLCGVSDTGMGKGRFWDACGTVEYAAPEVIVVGECGYDGEKADVWSCGVVLYVMATGRMPFEGEVKAVWRKMMKAEFGLPKWVSPGLKWLLMRMLDPNPECRISVDEVMEDGWFCQGYDDVDDQVLAQV
ncbi:hypothetical protein RND81_13G188000 [Saponaria officinalis]|uniref:Protein kinase domain-containing protein n=1 Tax=Saponaria officinalis TaxID=3572 RepID=A0AAW1H6C8_SAPOF